MGKLILIFVSHNLQHTPWGKKTECVYKGMHCRVHHAEIGSTLWYCKSCLVQWCKNLVKMCVHQIVPSGDIHLTSSFASSVYKEIQTAYLDSLLTENPCNWTLIAVAKDKRCVILTFSVCGSPFMNCDNFLEIWSGNLGHMCCIKALDKKSIGIYNHKGYNSEKLNL